MKKLLNAFVCVGLSVGLASCTLTSCSPAPKQDVDAYVQPEQTAVQPMATSGLGAKTGKPAYLSELVKEYGSADKAFEAVTKYEKVVIDFYADWCGPCRGLGAALADLARERNDVLFVKVDVDAYSSISGRYGVRSIPTLLLFKNGSQVHRATGFDGAGKLKNTINQYL